MSFNGGYSSLNEGPIANDEKFLKHLYHGTSSNHSEDIKRDGLKPSDKRHGHTYVTTDPYIAIQEAHNTVHGDHGGFGDKKARGGKPMMVKINRNHPSVRGFKRDPEFAHSDDANKVFRTKNHIHPDAIESVEEITAPREDPEGHH